MTDDRDTFGTDLRLVFRTADDADLDVQGPDLGVVRGVDTLVQALTMRLLVDQGELGGLGHPRYGSRIRELLGEPLDRARRELLKSHVRNALRADPRVSEVSQVAVIPRGDARDVLDVVARVITTSGDEVVIEVPIDAG